jgi:hypothetical protein
VYRTLCNTYATLQVGVLQEDSLVHGKTNWCVLVCFEAAYVNIPVCSIPEVSWPNANELALPQEQH